MTVVLALLEAGSVFAAVFAAALTWMRSVLDAPAGPGDAAGRALVPAVCCLLAFYYNDLYDPRAVTGPGAFAARLPRAVAAALGLLVSVYIVLPGVRLGMAPSVAGLALAAIALLALRAASYALLGRGLFGERVLILGTSALAKSLVREIEARPCGRHHIVGIVADPVPGGGAPFPHPVLAPFDHLGRILDAVRPDRVVVAMAERRRRLAIDELLAARVRGVAVEDGTQFYERLTGKMAIESLVPSGIIFSRGFRVSRPDRFVARALDLAVAAAGLVTLAPLLGLIALAIRLDSRGPVFFTQERAGRDGRRFRLYKFRTMRPAPRPVSEWARDNGERITPIGRWLRAFRLDEVPQFVNILKGEMSLVGPRPHPVSNYRLFLETVPYYPLRAAVRPGITGWAQVRYGYANNLEEETEKMRYDLYYIKHRSLGLDLRVLCDTVKVVILGRGVAAEKSPPEPALAYPLPRLQVGSRRH
jgi:exopolysaccharide biosynthesis polyprenyl glycosylphosphotransferase